MMTHAPPSNHPGFPLDDLHILLNDQHKTHRSWWRQFFSFKTRSNDNLGNGWKPATIQSPILGGFVIISVTIIAALEVLSHISTRPENGGGLAFAQDVNSLSDLSVFGYTYIPTILAVCYSMMWSWVDLDIKRLEPWFQLSRSGGANAINSLLLEYPFDFLPFVPITALRRRHWSVFLAGFIMLMVFWIITPLQSAIFTTGTVTRSVTSTMATNGVLASLSSQNITLTTNFMDTAYGISWLAQKLPPFTTSDFALLPFQPSQGSSNTSLSERWTTTADIFHTNLTCSPAQVSMKGLSYTFSNGKGCTVPDIALIDTAGSNSTYMVTYIGYYDNPHNDWALQNRNCSSKFANNFLALWASNVTRIDNGAYSNLTAIFCETSYHAKVMEITVNASTQSIHNFRLANGSIPKVNLTKIFNVTNFEYLLGTGVPSATQKLNFPDEIILQQDARIKEFGITFPNSNMVGFAAGLNELPIESWSDPAILQRAFEKAHQLLLVTAFSTLTNTSFNMLDVRPGLRQDDPGAVILVRPISIAVEVGLGIIIVFTLSLWKLCHTRISHLHSDPASIADIMSMIPIETPLSHDIHDGDGKLTAAKLEAALAERKYSIIRKLNGKTILVPTIPDQHKKDASRSSTSTNNEGYSPVQPVELKPIAGLIFTSILFGAIVLIFLLQFWAAKYNGIRLPTDNSVIRSIIENYAPTVFATLIEPAWNILNRLLCMLQPFEDLRKGDALSSRSVEAKYTSLPPQLAFWRAFRAKHYILGFVCLIAVSTNILAVALSALLNERQTIVEVPFDSVQLFIPQFNGSSLVDPTQRSGLYYDHFYVAMSNVSYGNPLPPWINEDTFFLPFALTQDSGSSSSQISAQSFRGSTLGFGAKVSCSEASSASSTDRLLFQVLPDGSSVQFSTTRILPNGTEISCFHPRGASHSLNSTTNDIGAFTNGLSALEVAQYMDSSPNDGGFCSAAMTMGWVRVSEGTKLPIYNTTTMASRNVTQTVLVCTQKLLVAQYNVTVDPTGRILTSNRTSDFESDIKPYFSPNAVTKDQRNDPIATRNESQLFQQATAVISPFTVDDFKWHNDSFTSDWMNSLLGMILDSSELVDPAFPVPNATFIAPVVEALYGQLFAIMLGLNTHVFSSSSTPMVANAIYLETRLFVSPLMSRIAIAILSLQLIVAVIYYVYRPRQFLPRMPTSIASIIAFVVTSRAVEDFNGAGGIKDKKQGWEEKRYGYGRFVGTDGRTKVGIERQRLVVPLEVKNPYVKRRNWWNRARKDDETEVKTWI